jgi:hypothetical protein
MMWEGPERVFFGVGPPAGRVTLTANRASHMNGILTFFARYFVFRWRTIESYSLGFAVAETGIISTNRTRRDAIEHFLISIGFSP